MADPADFSAAPRTQIAAGKMWFRCYDGTWGYDEANPGFGDARFSPFDSATDGARVPSLYLARNRIGALLETVFHDVEPGAELAFEGTLRDHLLAHVLVPRRLEVADLRDAVLEQLGVPRSAVTASSAEHYPCTRRLARALHATGVDGIVWHSRQAELHRAAGRRVARSEAMVVFADRADLRRGDWPRTGPGSQSLATDSGRTLVDQLIAELDITLVTD